MSRSLAACASNGSLWPKNYDRTCSVNASTFKILLLPERRPSILLSNTKGHFTIMADEVVICCAGVVIARATARVLDTFQSQERSKSFGYVPGSGKYPKLCC